MAGDSDTLGRLRIGELSRRVGVSAELLRAWERRYGLITPARTAGGFRLYGLEDERRIARMLGHLAAGLSAAEAAALARREPAEPLGEPRPGAAPLDARDRLRLALDRFDEPGAHGALDQLLAAFSLDAVLRDVVIPYLCELGERWQCGEATVGQEHFASALLHGRLAGLARGWGGGGGPMALLGCVPGEQHDLGLICFGLALRGHGFRITFLGPDTPLESVAEAVVVLRPALVVLSATAAFHAAGTERQLARLAASGALALAGAGVDGGLARSVGASFLTDDPVTAAEHVAHSRDAEPSLV